ncbi:hypothetical protein CsatB_011559 [Cannabis sativa]|uniref:Uncharacterized protein n=2 Tax=Cannabis sativa TaxID=3483 RepID=A0A7J6HYB7_CANSA|nr:hypothetical protein G4B88_021340 [Cannabis sativa]
MQRLSQKQMGEKLQIGSKMERLRQSLMIRQKSYNNNVVPSPKSRLARTFSASISESARNFVRCHSGGRSYAAPAGEVLIRRALTPPKRRMTLRWWNFRSTPSRLSNMSMA